MAGPSSWSSILTVISAPRFRVASKKEATCKSKARKMGTLPELEAAAGPGHEPRECDAALSRAFGFLGKRWNGVLLGTLIRAGRLRRAQAGLGISDSMLSERLGELARPAWWCVRSSRARRSRSPTPLPPTARRCSRPCGPHHLGTGEPPRRAVRERRRTPGTHFADVTEWRVLLRDSGPAPAGAATDWRRTVSVSAEVDRSGAAHGVHQIQVLPPGSRRLRHCLRPPALPGPGMAAQPARPGSGAPC